MDLKEFKETYTLLNAELISLEISQADDILKISQVFNLANGKQAKFTFEDIIVYDFNSQNTCNLYLVSDCIFLETDNVVYLSLDPYNSKLGMHEHDRDYIESTNLRIEIL